MDRSNILISAIALNLFPQPKLENKLIAIDHRFRTTADSFDRCLSIEGSRRGSSGSGVEVHRASTLPFEIAPKRDFTPTPIASDSSMSQTISWLNLETIEGTKIVAVAPHACNA
jgi:hypothetical protein